MYTIKLANETEIKDLSMNGNNYVSTTKVDEKLFLNNLSEMKVLDEETEVEIIYHNVEFIQQKEESDGFYLVFREMTEQEVRDKKLDAKLEYIAMMADVDLMEM